MIGETDSSTRGFFAEGIDDRLKASFTKIAVSSSSPEEYSSGRDMEIEPSRITKHCDKYKMSLGSWASFVFLLPCHDSMI